MPSPGEEKISVRWLCLTADEKTAAGFVKTLRDAKIDATACGLAELTAALESPSKSGLVAFVQLDAWPEPLHQEFRDRIARIQPHGISWVWLAGAELTREPPSDIDIVIATATWTKTPGWHSQFVQRYAVLKTRAGQTRTLRDSMVERLNAKSELLEAMNHRLQQLSVTDELTGAYNQRHFRTILGDEISKGQRYTVPLSLLMVDVDHFKNINDRLGHLAGDAALAKIAENLTSGVRRVDTVCRYGGEEFAIILPMTPKAAATDLAERLRKRIEELSLTVSIGVATFPENAATPDSLLAAADKALYEAKKTGRNRVVAAQTAEEQAPQP